MTGISLLDQWLEAAERAAGTFANFDAVDVTERETPVPAIREHLCDLLRESAVDLAFLEDVTRRLGWAKAESIVRQRLPANATARRGRFGEVVGVFMLEQFEGYIVPIEKAHFAITGGQFSRALTLSTRRVLGLAVSATPDSRTLSLAIRLESKGIGVRGARSYDS